MTCRGRERDAIRMHHSRWNGNDRQWHARPGSREEMKTPKRKTETTKGSSNEKRSYTEIQSSNIRLTNTLAQICDLRCVEPVAPGLTRQPCARGMHYRRCLWRICGFGWRGAVLGFGR